MADLDELKSSPAYLRGRALASEGTKPLRFARLEAEIDPPHPKGWVTNEQGELIQPSQPWSKRSMQYELGTRTMRYLILEERGQVPAIHELLVVQLAIELGRL